ncbi:MAG: ferritin-like domain-containing protein [Syntrophomonadales bacterium]|jgi:bacterioferritin
MCEDWGYVKLLKSFEKRVIEEMRHAEQLIRRILFFDGTRIVSNLSNIHIGKDVPRQIENDRAAEEITASISRSTYILSTVLPQMAR